jgi:hemerythrin-like metal-binding protein
MSVGIPEVDEDHKHFIVLINDLNRSIADRMDPAEIQNRMQLIIDDAVLHFAKEEKLFFEWKYPNTASHANIHAQVMTKLQDLKQHFKPYGNDSGWMDAGMQIKHLLIDHIQQEDMKYAEYFQNTRGATAVEAV